MKQENKILKKLLEAHNLKVIEYKDWLLPNGELPAIQAFWNPEASENVGQLTIEIIYDNNLKSIIEQFGGYGEKETQLMRAFDNFSKNSLHLFLALFWNSSMELVKKELWRVNDKKYIAYIGDLVITSIGESKVEIPKNYEDRVKELITKEPLYNPLHWFGFYYSEPYNIVSSSKDNIPWNKGVEALKELDWKKTESFYGVRNLIVLKRV